MRKTGIFKGFAVWLLVILILIQNLSVLSFAEISDNALDNYGSYSSEHFDNGFCDTAILLNSQNSSGTVLSIEGKDCNIIDNSSKEIAYNFDVAESGLYNISVTYYDLLDTSLYLKLGFYFDGKVQFSELENVSFSKIYENAESKIKKDEMGNELRPIQKAKQRFNTEWVESETGTQSKPYAVYLEAGNHTLEVKRVSGSVAISEIELKAYKDAVSYKEYIEQFSSENGKGKKSYTIEAEDVFEVSHSTLAATINDTNAGMSPISSTKKLVNSFGQNYWIANGQWGSWVVPEDVEEGFYELSFRAKQTGSVGVSSYRRLYINGEVPFAEAESIDFPYNSKWQICKVGGENNYLVHLKAGDVITLEATTGALADIISEIDATIDELNEIYQSIIIVTGVNPDTNRDYNLKAAVPTLLDDMAAASKKIKKISNGISSVMGETNTKVYFLKRFIDALDGYVANYRSIVGNLGELKEYIDSFAAQTYEFNSMPLELDWIMLSKSDVKQVSANASFVKSFGFEIKRFLYTFSDDYNAVAVKKNKNAKTVTVWSSAGRDQAQAIKSLINNDFAAKHTNIFIDFKMTETSLAEAVLSGKEPDVSLSVLQDVPINMALRGQALDLTPYLENNAEFVSEISESAWIPFQYKGGTYAIPVTQDYYMMFYRKDILSKLGLTELPQTWDELYHTIRELQKVNFSVGIKETDSASAGVSTAIHIFDMFLYQNGGKYFNDELTKTDFESKIAKNAFNDWVALYRDYGLQKDFNVLTRFRSGEMPIILTGYSFYMQLSATAPEISGRWGMTLLPGTQKADGTIDRTATSTVTGVMVLKGAEKRGVADEAFEFAKWWASSELQFQYSNAMESIQGIAGRQMSANRKTFEKLNWSDSEREILNSQHRWITAVNQIPGTYIINRSLTNALRSSYESTAVDALRQLNVQNTLINTELDRKRKEFDESN